MSELRNLVEDSAWDEAAQLLKDTPKDNLSSLLTNTDPQGHTALYAALWNQAPESLLLTMMDHSPTKVFFAKNNHDWTTLHAAAERGAPHKVIERLVRRNPGALDEKNDGGETPRARFNGLAEASVELIGKSVQDALRDQLPAAEVERIQLKKELERLTAAS